MTAHGGRSSQKGNAHNTKIYMWNRQTMEAARLASLIEGLPEGVSVMTVMVQCYSGGFSHLIFEQNEAKKGNTERTICGFFSTVCDREAAGCTPDVDEENYDEFSSHFWAALRGKTRMDRSVESPDYDEDGRVSFEEAHAYAILTSRNIDVPVKTSDAFLRVHGKLEGKGLLSLKTPYSELLALARPVERVVLEGLSKELDLVGEDRGREDEEEGRFARAGAEGSRREPEGAQEIARYRAPPGSRRNIRNRWPELSNTHSTGAHRLLGESSEEFVKGVEGHEKFGAWREMVERKEELEEEKHALRETYALHARFVRALENVVLAENLEKSASKEIRKKYARLLEAEGGGF